MAAAIKERTGDIKDMLLTDICPFSLGTELYDGSFSPVIEKNETLPCKRTMYYTTVRNNQITMNFPIYQGENIKASDNLKMASNSNSASRIGKPLSRRVKLKRRNIA
jgi:molecular chaperone HscC